MYNISRLKRVDEFPLVVYILVYRILEIVKSKYFDKPTMIPRHLYIY